MTVSELQGCVLQRWSPQIGDPGLTGWLTVLAYAACTLLALAVWRRLKGQRGRVFWLVLSLLLAALAVNKQLDLQSAVTAAGKCLARAQGWYDQRRVMQVLFIGAVVAAALVLLVSMTASLWGRLRYNLMAAIGLTLVLCFVLVRALSFHHFDRLIGTTNFGVTNNFLFENAGLVLIAVNATWLLARKRVPSRRSPAARAG